MQNLKGSLKKSTETKKNRQWFFANGQKNENEDFDSQSVSSLLAKSIIIASH